MAGVLVGDWFYHRRRGGEFVRHESLVRSLLFHFFQQDRTLFQEFFRSAYRPMDPREPAPWTWDLLSGILIRICQSSRRIFCVVDAVDEAESTAVLALIRSATDSKTRSKARFIILSRPNVYISREMKSLPCIVVENENTKDIERVIDLGLSSLRQTMHQLDFDTPNPAHPPSRRLPRHATMRRPRHRSLATSAAREDRALSDIRKDLQAKAQGSILWVKLVLDRLIQEAAGNEGVTLEELRKLMNHIPEELAEYYKQIEKDITTSRSPQRVRETRQALMWVCATPELGDVTLEGLWEALALLKDDFEAQALEEVWEQQIPVSSYDELWRKVQCICGPFVEIFNPGLSADESRIYRYCAASVVQLMHQSVRDFLCNSDAAGGLHFTLEEARGFVHSHLDRYLHLLVDGNSRISSDGPYEPQFVVDWLNDQKLLRLASKSGMERHAPILGAAWSIRRWVLQHPIAGSQEALMISTIRDPAGFEVQDEFDVGDRDEMLKIGRILYHACIEGLDTAVQNIFSMPFGSVRSPACVRILSACVLFAASRCTSPRVTVELGLNEVTRSYHVSMSPGYKPFGTPGISLPSAQQTHQTAKRPHGGTQLPSVQVKDANSEWVTSPWRVTLSVDKENCSGEVVMDFTQWCPFLDLVCGSKRRRLGLSTEVQRGLKGGEEHDDRILAATDDVEDAIGRFCIQITQQD